MSVSGGGPISWVTPVDIGETRFVEGGARSLTWEGLAACSATVVQPGAVILSTRAPIGSVAIASVPVATNQGCRALLPVSNLRPGFLYYVLVTARPTLEAMGSGATFLELSAFSTGSIRLPLPPLSEQQCIVDFLDEETAKIDTLVAELAGFAALLKARDKSLVAECMTQGVPHRRSGRAMKDSGVDWIGQVPEEWRLGPLKRGVISVSGGVWGDDPDGSPLDVMVLRSTEQTEDGYWRINDPAWRKVTPMDLDGKVAQRGDILVTKSSGSLLHIGKATLVDDEVAQMNASYSNFMARLVPYTSVVEPSFLWRYLNSQQAKAYFSLSMSSSVGLGNLNASILSNMPLFFPSLSEQQEIAAYLDEELAKSRQLQGELENQVNLLKAYRKSLISEVVTGKMEI